MYLIYYLPFSFTFSVLILSSQRVIVIYNCLKMQFITTSSGSILYFSDFYLEVLPFLLAVAGRDIFSNSMMGISSSKSVS